MTASRSGHLSIFGLVFFEFKFSGNYKTMESLKMCNFDPKASESCENLNLSNAGYYKGVVGNILLEKYLFFSR